MEFEGIITYIGEEQEVGQNGLLKLTFVVEEISDREYKNSIAVDLFKEKVELIKPYKVGDKVKLSLNFRAREYNGKWFNSIGAWKLEGLSGGQSSTGNASEAEDDLPF